MKNNQNLLIALSAPLAVPVCTGDSQLRNAMLYTCPSRMFCVIT